MKSEKTEREYDFALVINGVSELTDQVADALYAAGCNDATFSIQYGRLCAEFSRRAKSPEAAILSAIDDVCRAGVGATVARIDDSDLVTQSEIARRTGRSRQQIHQFVIGSRGPGHFPPPECHLVEGAPLWRWCAVSHWLAENDIIRAEEPWNAKVIATINAVLELSRLSKDEPELVKAVKKSVPKLCLL